MVSILVSLFTADSPFLHWLPEINFSPLLNIFTVSFWVKAAKSTSQVFVADPKIVIGTLNSLLYVVPTS